MLFMTYARLVEFGRHKGLKIPRPKSRSGSSPEAGTKKINLNTVLNIIIIF